MNQFLNDILTATKRTYTALEYINKQNRALLDQYNAPITINENAAEIILYHGTRAPINKILREGLLVRAGRTGPNTKLQMIDEVLQGEFGVTREQIPDWIWRHEYEYELTEPPHLHMSINLGTAIGYAYQGCEIKASIRKNMFFWLLQKRGQKITAKQKQLISKIAAERNGETPHVIQVKIPVGWLYRPDLELWRQLLKKIKREHYRNPQLNCLELLKTTTLEIRCLQNIPPEKITAIYKIKFQDPLGIKFKIMEVKKWRKTQKK